MTNSLLPIENNVCSGSGRRSKFYVQIAQIAVWTIMFWLYYLISGLKFIKHKKDLNWVDRLCYHWTTVLLLCCAITVTAKQYVGSPIQCWVPATFTEPMEQYAENYCWAANTYFVSMNESIPKTGDRGARELTYYQWVPFMLALQAVVVCIPCIIWRALYWQTGFDLAAMVEAASEIRVQAGDDRKRLLFLLCSYMYETCMRQKDLGLKAKRVRNGFFPAWYRGCYVTVLCCMSKCLCFINCAFQLALLNVFLQLDRPFYGVEVLQHLVSGRPWQKTGLFPRVTMCDFEIREMANIHRHTIQCVLVINMFNEKIFIMLWFWFLLQMLLVGYNFTCMVFYSFSENQRLIFLERYFIPKEPSLNHHLKIQQLQLRRFLIDVLQYDGVLILKSIAAHAGEFVCSEVITSLYEWHENPDLRTSTAAVPDMTLHRPSGDTHPRSIVSGVSEQVSPSQPQPIQVTTAARRIPLREFKERGFQPGHRTMSTKYSKMSGRQRRTSTESDGPRGFFKNKKNSPETGYLAFA